MRPWIGFPLRTGAQRPWVLVLTGSGGDDLARGPAAHRAVVEDGQLARLQVDPPEGAQ
jgi:hypothetical protein